MTAERRLVRKELAVVTTLTRPTSHDLFTPLEDS